MGFKDKVKWIRVGKDINGVYFDSFTVGKLKLIKDLGSVILVGSKDGDGLLRDNKKILKSFENKKIHTQLVTKLFLNSGNEK